jgi:hypothetical protein
MTKTKHLIVLDDEGHEYHGTPAEIVTQMHYLSFAPSRSDAAWMDEVADRAYSQTGYNIDSSSPERFIQGMLEAGLLKPKVK